MGDIIDQWSNSDYAYGHGIICRKCLARKYTEGGSAVELVSVGTFVRVHSIRDDDVLFCIVHDDMQVDTNQLLCKRTDIIHVPENLWGPLFTIPKCARLPLVEDRKTAENMGNISVGHTVQVLGPDKTSICIANVTFKNTIARLGVGIFFGLQVLEPKDNLQAIIRSVSLLEPGTKGFPRGCDIVVTVDKIYPYKVTYNKEKVNHHYGKELQKDLVKSVGSGEESNNTNFKSTLVLNLKDKFSSTLKKSQQGNSPGGDGGIITSSLKKTGSSENSLSLGEEVIYLNGNTPEKGVVRWIGYLKNSLKVGVEFEKPIGSGTGAVDGLELFKTKFKHALILPPKALIKLSDYTNTKEDIQYKNNNNYNINNNNNNNSNSHGSSSSNINYNNTYNNNYNNNNWRSNEFCCDNKFSDDKFKLSKTSTHQCMKHPERTLQCTDLLQPKSNEEVIQSKHSFQSKVCKSDQMFDMQYQHISKSFDLSKPSERKISYRRHFNSLDSELLQNNELKLQNTSVSTPKFSNKDLYDFMGMNPSKQDCCLDKMVQKDTVDNVFHKSPSCYSNGECSPHYKEKDILDSRRSDHSSSDECLPHCYDSPRIPFSDTCHPEELGKGSLVELSYKGEPHYGVIRWIGTLPEDKDNLSPRLIAGIEMEEEMDCFTDGTFNGRRYFHCNPKKALFVPLNKCRKDSRFADESHRQPLPSKINYGQIDCPVVEGVIPPLNRKGDIESICGKNRGIQGHHNSCYLDATLFSMFAFTSVFDSLLYRPPTKLDIPQYGEVQRVLREEVVNPLRKNLYVRADRVMKLRTLLDKLSSVSGLTSEEKDPEEFLNSLLAQILKAEPFLKLSSGQEAFHYQLFVEKDERLVFPSVQQLFEQSFVTSDIKLKQVPSCLIIQMPRFGKSFKMYSRILPPQLLDVTDIIENSPRQCTVCGKLAEYECKECFGQNGIGSGLESISFCKICIETAHNHHCRTRHNYRPLTVPVEFYELQEHCIIPRLYLELFAVVCIETSHYVAFVKCGSGSDAPWCFFDSMADRKGEQNGYNIPEMVPCPDLPYWLSEDGAKMLNETGDDRQLPEHAKRLFSDAYMCMYQSPDLMMYR